MKLGSCVQNLIIHRGDNVPISRLFGHVRETISDLRFDFVDERGATVAPADRLKAISRWACLRFRVVFSLYCTL